MQVVNTFISDPGVKIPGYTVYSLQKLRENNPDTPITFISNEGHGFDNVFKKYNVNWVDQRTLSSFYLESFWRLSDLERHGTPNTKYPSPPKFFHRALERIFMLQAYMAREKIGKVFHTENDVLTYYPLSEVHNNISFYPDFPDSYITPMGPKISTFAFAYFHSLWGMNPLCCQFLEFLWMGEEKFLKLSGADMLNEMTMLREAQNNLDIGEFRTVIGYGQNFMFDPGSYGQYLGGTNNHDHGPGYAGNHHYIGKLINEFKIKPIFKNGKPYVIIPDINKSLADSTYPVFNLHIHSKNLKDFM